jgi:hypothetical protein
MTTRLWPGERLLYRLARSQSAYASVYALVAFALAVSACFVAIFWTLNA